MVWRQSWKKYHNKSASYDGYTYMSKAEAGQAAELDLRKKANDIRDWERQIPIELRVNGKLICKYICDFLIHHMDGSKELVEVKGFETEVYRLKRKLLEASFLVDNPEYKYSVVKV